MRKIPPFKPQLPLEPPPVMQLSEDNEALTEKVQKEGMETFIKEFEARQWSWEKVIEVTLEVALILLITTFILILGQRILKAWREPKAVLERRLRQLILYCRMKKLPPSQAIIKASQIVRGFFHSKGLPSYSLTSQELAGFCPESWQTLFLWSDTIKYAQQSLSQEEALEILEKAASTPPPSSSYP